MASRTANVELYEVPCDAEHRPTLPRSGHVGVTLPAWHEHDLLIVTGYTEDADKKRKVVDEGWMFNVGQQKWFPVKYANAGPQARTACVPHH